MNNKGIYLSVYNNINRYRYQGDRTNKPTMKFSIGNCAVKRGTTLYRYVRPEIMCVRTYTITNRTRLLQQL